MKILFMGTPDISVPTLEALVASEHEVVGVVSQPDRPKGRGKQLQPTPVKATALKYGLTVFQPQRVKDTAFLEEISRVNFDVAVVIAFGQILPKAFLSLPRYGCVNIHTSLLPAYRGAGPIQRSIINGDLKTGVTTMMMDEGMDTGDILLQEEVILDGKETGGSLFEKLSLIGGPLVIRTLEQIEAGTLVMTKQDEDEATYAPMLDKKMGNIDWKMPAITIERLIRGLNPWPSAYTYLGGKMLKIWDADLVDLEDGSSDPGAISAVGQEGFIVKCGEQGLKINSLQLQGKKRMATGDFLRGYQLEPGTMLSQIPKEQ